MAKCVYRERRTYSKYDATHIIGYLNETIVKGYQPKAEEGEKPKPFDGYQYEGPESDGGTILLCSRPGNRDDMINSIIRSRYTLSEELAIHRHHSGAEATIYNDEWDIYNNFCEEAKMIVDEWLNH